MARRSLGHAAGSLRLERSATPKEATLTIDQPLRALTLGLTIACAACQARISSDSRNTSATTGITPTTLNVVYDNDITVDCYTDDYMAALAGVGDVALKAI